MTQAAFGDTSAWFAALNPRLGDNAIARPALEALQSDGNQLVTTSLVVAELHALLATRLFPAVGLRFLDEAAADPTVTVIPVDGALQTAAVDRWLRVYRDVPFSLCDAVSFEVMRREGITRAFTLDHHFAVAGFTMVPGPQVPKGRQPRTRR